MFLTLAAGQIVGLLLAILPVALSGESIPPTEALVWAGVGGVSGVCGLGTFYLALSRGTMGIVAPLTALIGAAVPAVVGIVGGETPSPLQGAGLVLALAAVVLISLPGGGDAPSATASTSRMDAGLAASARGRPSASELLLILVAGLGFAGFFLGLDAAHAVGGATWWPILVVRVAGIVVVAVAAAVLLARRRLPGLRAPRRVWPLFVVAGSGDLGGNLFFVAARGAGSLPVAVVVSSLYPVVTALLARFLVGERLTQPQLVGVAAAVVGVMLIAAGGV